MKKIMLLLIVALSYIFTPTFLYAEIKVWANWDTNERHFEQEGKVLKDVYNFDTAKLEGEFLFQGDNIYYKAYGYTIRIGQILEDVSYPDVSLGFHDTRSVKFEPYICDSNLDYPGVFKLTRPFQELADEQLEANQKAVRDFQTTEALVKRFRGELLLINGNGGVRFEKYSVAEVKRRGGRYYADRVSGWGYLASSMAGGRNRYGLEFEIRIHPDSKVSLLHVSKRTRIESSLFNPEEVRSTVTLNYTRPNPWAFWFFRRSTSAQYLCINHLVDPNQTDLDY